MKNFKTVIVIALAALCLAAHPLYSVAKLHALEVKAATLKTELALLKAEEATNLMLYRMENGKELTHNENSLY